MGKIEKRILIERLEIRNMAMDYTALWCSECLDCSIYPRDVAGKDWLIIHKGSSTCDAPLKEGHLAECIRDLKGETEK